MSPTACDRRRVLVAEDDAAARALYDAIISEDVPDVSIDLAANGAEAVKFFDSRHHAVIVMDLHMPVLNGLEAFRQIEEICRNKAWAMPSVVFCTAYAPPKAFVDIVAEGQPHCLLTKPMTSQQLVATVKDRLDA